MVRKVWLRHVQDYVIDLNHIAFQEIQDIKLDKNGVLYVDYFSSQINSHVLVARQDFAPNLKVENIEIKLVLKIKFGN